MLAVLPLVPVMAGDYVAYQIGLYLLYAMVAQGIALTWGRAGFLPLGQALFFGLGAYLAGFALKAVPGSALLLVLLIAAALLPAALAWLIGRLVFARRHESGPYFSLITLALAMLGFQIANQWSSVTGGFNGLGGIPELPGIDRYGSLYYLIAAFSIIVTGAFAWLGTTPLGTLWAAIAQNEGRLQSFGFATDRLKALAFGVSAGAAGLAGSLYAAHQGLVTPQATGFLLSAEFVIWTAVGGRTSPYGALLGAVGIGLLSSELREHVGYWEAIVAIVFIVVVLRFPGGLLGGLHAGARLAFTAMAAGRRGAPRLPNAARPMSEPRLAPQPTTLPTILPTPLPAPAVKHAGLGRAATLRYQDVNVRSSGVSILNGLRLDIDGGGIHCLIGPNGAGKTSSFNVLAGRLPLTSGRIFLGSRDVSGRRADVIARLGVGRKFQIPSVFAQLSVADNLRIALWANRLSRSQMLMQEPHRWSTPMLDRIRAHLDFLHVAGERETNEAGTLSQGQRQMLELAMAVLSEPRLLLLDEPCAGLSAQETERQIAIIAGSVDALGATALIIEHDMAAVQALASQVHVLHQGRLLASGTLAQIQSDTAVRQVYAGGHK